MKQITKAEFLNLYERNQIEEVINVDGKLYGRTSNNTEAEQFYKTVVWCNI